MTRQPGVHIRRNRLVGNRNRLNGKAIKVLASIKFSPSSITREEIMQKTSLSQQEVEQQIKLLLHYRLIKTNAMFPSFPMLGWRVFTDSSKHIQIITILRQHGYQDEPSSSTRRALHGYYPTGMDLEKLGKQPDNRRGYPNNREINEDIEYRAVTMRTMFKWRDEHKPFKPKEYSVEAVNDKKRKWIWIIKKLSKIYQITEPTFRWGTFNKQLWETSGSSFNDNMGRSSSYSRGTNTLFITGKFSVITLLHEFGHVRGFDETDAVMWSVNLYKRIFPISYSRLVSQGGHCLVQPNREVHFEL